MKRTLDPAGTLAPSGARGGTQRPAASSSSLRATLVRTGLAVLVPSSVLSWVGVAALFANARSGLHAAQGAAELPPAGTLPESALVQVLLLLLLVACAQVGLFVLLISRAARRVVEPLSELACAAHAVASGKREARAVVAGPDELSQLAVALNHMLDENQTAFEKLELTVQRAQRVARAATKPESASAEAKSRLRILVVDDNQINQFVAVETLEWLGYETDVANHGDEAVEMISAGAYDLVLMDCQMPVLDGCSATRRVREREKLTGEHQVIVALTAHAIPGERERVLAAGMDDFLVKPLDIEELQRTLAKYLPTPQVRPSTPQFSHSAQGMAHAALLEPSVPALAAGVERSRDLVETCLRHMPTQLEETAAALRARDGTQLRASAHKLKGSAMAIAADHLSELAERLQCAAEKSSLGEADQLIAYLKLEFDRVEQALLAELAPLAS